jgi:hypothetical protein
LDKKLSGLKMLSGFFNKESHKMRKTLIMMTGIFLASSATMAETDLETNTETRNKAYVLLAIGIISLAVSVPLTITSTNTFVKRDPENFNKITGGIGLSISVPLLISGLNILTSSMQLFSSSKTPMEVKEPRN